MIEGQGRGDIVLKRMLFAISLVTCLAAIISIAFDNFSHFGSFDRSPSHNQSAFNETITASLVFFFALFSFSGIYRNNKRESSLGLLFGILAFSVYYLQAMPAFIHEVHPDKLVIAVGSDNSSLSETTTFVTLISNQTLVNESLETSMAINLTMSVTEVDTTILTVDVNPEEPKEVPVMYIILKTVLTIFLISILSLCMVYVSRLHAFVDEGISLTFQVSN